MASRKWLLPCVLLTAGLWSLWLAFTPAPVCRRDIEIVAVAGGRSTQRFPKTVLCARGGEAEEESVEVGGFSAFVVGLALLPFIGCALSLGFNVIFAGESFEFGPFGLQFLSVIISLGVVLWSIGSLFQRGKGLPAGWLGLLGFAEGLSYLAALLLAVAAVASSFRSPPPPKPESQAPTYRPATSYTAPIIRSVPKAPEVKIPSLPSFTPPELPTFKPPEIKVPEFRVPDIKTPSRKTYQPTSEFDDLSGLETTTDKKSSEARRREEAKKAEEERRAEEAKKREERNAEEAKKREEAKRAEEEKRAEEARKREERNAEEARKREEAKRAEEERRAEEARRRAEGKKAEVKEVPKEETQGAEDQGKQSVGSFLADLGRLGRSTEPPKEQPKEEKKAMPAPSIKYDLFDL